MSLNSWRSKPYLLLFPLGCLLAWAGVLHWLLHSVGLVADYRPVLGHGGAPADVASRLVPAGAVELILQDFGHTTP